jgi:hypothetical protein
MGKLDLKDVVIANSCNGFYYMTIYDRVYVSHGRCGWKRKNDLIKSFKSSSIWFTLCEYAKSEGKTPNDYLKELQQNETIKIYHYE